MRMIYSLTARNLLDKCTGASRKITKGDGNFRHKPVFLVETVVMRDLS
jgi:hypothetical protein